MEFHLCNYVAIYIFHYVVLSSSGCTCDFQNWPLNKHRRKSEHIINALATKTDALQCLQA